MPMSLYLSSSVSADSLNLALSFFTICLFLNLALKDDKIQKKDMIFLSICILSLALSKQVYALLALLFFIIPKSKFNNNVLTCFILMILPSVLLLFILQYNYLIDMFGLCVNSSSSLPNPSYPAASFFVRFLNSLLIGSKGYLISFVGSFGWSTNPLPSSLAYIYFVILSIISIVDLSQLKEKFLKVLCINIKQKIILLFIFFQGILLIFFVASGWKISSVIWGVRGRYFIPFSPLFFLTLQNKRIISIVSRKDYFKYLNFSIIIFVGVILLISTYYLYNIGLSTYLEYNY
jgi:uncharacterized membrane protein